MCGRYTLTDPDPRLLRFRFDLRESVEIAEEPRFNIAPTDPVIAVRLDREGERQAGRLRWGLIPHFADPESFDRLLINARAESVAAAPVFRDAFDGFRCLIPADGFYEWRRDETGKQPVWISRPERELFAFAGLWARAKREDGEPLYSCAIVTCSPSEQLVSIHNRMPVILGPEAESTWLDRATGADELAAMLRPAEGLEVTEVSDLVNSVRNDGPELLAPPPRLF